MNNETDTSPLLEFVWHVERILLPALIIFGSLCNIMTFIVMRRRRMRISSTCFYMAVLAVTDTLVLWTGCLNLWLHLMRFPIVVVQSNFTCKLVPFLFYIFADASVWITVCMSFERYFAVSRPLRASQMCTTRRAKWVLVVIFAVLTLIDGHFLITLQIQVVEHSPTCQPAIWAQFFVQKIFVYIDGLKYSAIPFCLLILLSILIIQRVFQAESISAQLRNLRELHRYQKHSLSSNSSATGGSSLLMVNSSQSTTLNNARVGRRITFMLLSVSIAFCVFSAPMSLMQIVQSVSDPQHNQTPLAIGKAIAEICQYINHSCNFFLYALTGRIFRREFVRFFFPTRFGKSTAKPASAPRAGLNENPCLLQHAGQSSSRHGSLYSVDNNHPSLYRTSRRLTALSLKNYNNQGIRQNRQSYTVKSPLLFDPNPSLPINRHNNINYDKSQILTHRNSGDHSPFYALWNLLGRKKKREVIGDGPFLFVNVLKPTNHQFHCN